MFSHSLDPFPPFKIGPVSEREGRESGLLADGAAVRARPFEASVPPEAQMASRQRLLIGDEERS